MTRWLSGDKVQIPEGFATIVSQPELKSRPAWAEAFRACDIITWALKRACAPIAAAR